MPELLDAPGIQKRSAPITLDRYHRMIESGVFADWNVELLNGVLVEKMSKSPLYVQIVRQIFFRLLDLFPPPAWLVQKEDPLTLGTSEPEPDISVVEGPEERFGLANPDSALFVAEVSIHTLAVDRDKAAIYAAAGVPEYWIVRPEAAVTEVHRAPDGEKYTDRESVPAEVEIVSTALEGFTFRLADALPRD